MITKFSLKQLCCAAKTAKIGLLLFVILFLCPYSLATPPSYSTFGRQQKTDYQPQADRLLRIWMVYVDQGDGLLIQLPSRYDYDLESNGDSSPNKEPIDILIDGGSEPENQAIRTMDFIKQLYPNGPAIIEYAVLTHHDNDHVAGLIKLLKDNDIIVQNIYHNGLASYKPGHRGFPTGNQKPANAVYKATNGAISQGMAFLTSDNLINNQYLVDNLGELRQGNSDGDFVGTYADLANAAANRAESGELIKFARAYVGAPFIIQSEQELNHNYSGLNIEVMWPLTELKSYGGRDWGKTINGNSVVFRLQYGDFEMLFAGDLNAESESSMVNYWKGQGKIVDLNCDVLKVPHHGSADAYQPFFDGTEIQPVIGIASMGNKGFKSKAMGRNNWQHPSEEVIQWLGGAHRFYSTYVQEKKFQWANITSEKKRQALIERTHILIETDGEWFRLVELPADSNDLEPPSVTETARSNGTRWISAR
jgi:beta-lactamase superfamily II metal-dependent hydrolase